MLASGICGSQIGEIYWVKGPDRFLPHLLGHEGCGVVLEVGEGVRTVKPGDKVLWFTWRRGGGWESTNARYCSKLGLGVNAGWVTTFNEMAIVSENRVTAAPPRPGFRRRGGRPAGLGPVTTGFGVINNNAQLKIGQSIAIFGAGGIGLNVIQGAVLAGAHPIVAVDLYDAKLEFARKFGATHTINSRQTDARAEIQRLLGSGGADVVVDVTGQVEVIEAAYELAGPTGRVILVGVPAKGKKPLLLHPAAALRQGDHGLARGRDRPDRGHPALRPAAPGRQAAAPGADHRPHAAGPD